MYKTRAEIVEAIRLIHNAAPRGKTRKALKQLWIECQEEWKGNNSETFKENERRIRTFLKKKPGSTRREIAEALSLHPNTVDSVIKTMEDVQPKGRRRTGKRGANPRKWYVTE